ncbi:hypothetical protein Tco_0191016, partial [Tanacetum coccineum]
KKDKDEGVLMVVKKGKEVVLNEKVKCDPVNILTRMSPSYLKNVLDSLTTQHVSVLEELGLGEYHNNFNFTSTLGALGMWLTYSKNGGCLTETGWNFKVGFLVIFFSIQAQGNKDGTVNQRFIPTLQDIDKFKNYDWCKNILDCIREEIMEFKQKSKFYGPLVLLALIYCSSIVSPTTVVERKAPIFKHWSIELKTKENFEEKEIQTEYIRNGSMSQQEELEQFKSKTVQDMKDCLSDNLSKIKALLAFFKELNHRDDDNAMVVLDNGNDVPEESVKDNEVSKEKDDVTKKQKDVEKMFELDKKNTVQEINREKDVEKVVDQDVDKPEDVEKESEFGNNKLVNDELRFVNTECENDNDSGKKEIEKNTEDLIKGTVVCVEISKKEVSKGVLAINEDPLKDSQLETSIFNSQPEDSQPEAQDSQPGMEIGAEI